MAKLEHFVIHTEPDDLMEDKCVETSIELSFVCTDHCTVVECDYVRDYSLELIQAIIDIYNNEEECIYNIAQDIHGFVHTVTIVRGGECGENGDLKISCDKVSVTEIDD